jgi:hypothetical protein
MAKADADSIVEAQVVLALPTRSLQATVRLPAGSTLADAVRASGLIQQADRVHADERIAELAAVMSGAWSVGVYGKLRQPDELLRAGDRVEIYRPLTIDPKDARRVRADVKRRGDRRRAGRTDAGKPPV